MTVLAGDDKLRMQYARDSSYTQLIGKTLFMIDVACVDLGVVQPMSIRIVNVGATLLLMATSCGSTQANALKMWRLESCNGDNNSSRCNDSLSCRCHRFAQYCATQSQCHRSFEK